MTDETTAKRLEDKMDRILRLLERLEDRVSAIETGMLDAMNAKRSG